MQRSDIHEYLEEHRQEIEDWQRAERERRKREKETEKKTTRIIVVVAAVILFFWYRSCDRQQDFLEACENLEADIDDKESWKRIERAAGRGDAKAVSLVKGYEHLRYVRKVGRRHDIQEATESLENEITDVIISEAPDPGDRPGPW